MSNVLNIELTFSESSTLKQQQEIESELYVLFSEYLKPNSISCREGSTIVDIQYILDTVTDGFLKAVGAGVFAFILTMIKQKKESKLEKNTSSNPKELINASPKEQEIRNFLEKNVTNHQPIEEKSMDISDELKRLLQFSNYGEMSIVFKTERDGQIINKGIMFKFDDENKIHEFYSYEHRKDKD